MRWVTHVRAHSGRLVRGDRTVDSLIEDMTGGYVTEVKIVLTSIVAALAIYQAFMMAVGYGKLRLPFLTSRAASLAHRSVGDAIVPITLLIAAMCLGYFGIEDGLEHAPPPVRST